MAKALTAAALEKFRPDPNKRLEIPDGLLTGLYFIVQPTGRKSWAVRYRAHGRPRKLVLGKYPALNLSEARTEAKAALQRIQKGEDPAAEKQISKKRAKVEDEVDRIRFGSVARLFLARYAKPKNRSWKETARQLGLVPDKSKPESADDPKTFLLAKGSAVDKWGHRPIDSITRGEVIAFLDDIVDRGAPILANRVLAALRKLFNWSIQRDLLHASPCEKVKPPTAEKSRDRVLSDEELKALWQASDALGWPFGQLLQMLVLTGQRREEVGSMKWQEVSGDIWVLPRERVKTDKAHDVPLSTAAVAILERLPRIKGAGYVFTTTGQKPVSGFSKAKDALDAKMLAILRKQAEEREGDPEAVTLEPWRLHDIRRTMASGMARLGIGIAVIEKILNHTSGTFGGIVGVYQRHEFADEKRRALEAWASFVGSLVEDRPANVVTMRAGQ